MRRRVVVTGMGAVTPLGAGAETLHHGAVRGDSGIADGLGRCADFDPMKVLSRREALRMDRFCHLAVAAADEAVRLAGWGAAPPAPPERVHCVIGTAIGGLHTLEAQLNVLRAEGPEYVSPLTVPLLMANAAPAHLSMRFGLAGETSALATACSSGAQAIVAGARVIRSGEADAAIVGGAEAATSDFTQAMFTSSGALSPTGMSVPFDRTRDGFILGEGAGVLVLEAAETARARGAPVLGEILGYGVTSDHHHVTAPEPSGAFAAAAVRAALADSGIDARDVAYINAHGTGTRLNDAAESTALRRALGDALAAIPISSTKSYVGHLLGAAGAVEAIATLQALRYRTAPPTHGLTEPDQELGPLAHVQAALALKPSDKGCIGLTNSMGFGGHNVTIVIGA
ncbi:beta-ketoacyl-[acyl-carrier-protein] synthase family protein [Streptomyces collinus]|uniref:beta-ketoacyl-[acyl-carrier-protein] synthase family protein n=1 Tax=Streptomyces collinus TaxID=42684 RepID=UPI0036342331